MRDFLLAEIAWDKGVRPQTCKDGGPSDAVTFVLAPGLPWKYPAGRTRTGADPAEWPGARADRMAPRGRPKGNRSA